MTYIRDILQKQEEADGKLCDYTALIREEYENADEILSGFSEPETELKTYGDVSKSSVLPVRKSDSLYVKKHTSSQRPYFHSQTFYEIVCAVTGKIECAFSEFANEKLIKGDVIVIAPRTVHALSRVTDKDVVLKTVVPRKVYSELNIDPTGGAPFARFRLNAAAEYYLYRLLKECVLGDSRSEAAKKMLTALLTMELERGDSPASDVNYAKLLSDYFENSPDSELNELSVACGYSREYLGRTIKRFTGKTFSEHLGDFRAERAKRLLTDTSLSIDEIARMTGFKTRSGFWKNFSERFGVSPAAYRNSLK